MLNLSQKLLNFKSSFDQETPNEVLETLSRSISLLQNSDLRSRAVDLGNPAPPIMAVTPEGSLVRSDELLANGPVIISFIRGGWCPYCMLEMQAWQELIEQSDFPVNFIALTGEIPEVAMQAVEDNDLSFPILTDVNYRIAKQFGLAWNLDEGMRQQLIKWGIDLYERTCNNNLLPVPATYIIDTDGKVSYRFLEEDYTSRAEPEEVLKVYKQMLVN